MSTSPESVPPIPAYTLPSLASCVTVLGVVVAIAGLPAGKDHVQQSFDAVTAGLLLLVLGQLLRLNKTLAAFVPPNQPPGPTGAA